MRREINWRLVIHVAALIGGVLWGALGALAIGQAVTDTTGSGAANWWPAVVSSVLVLAGGVITSVSARSIAVRSMGIAAIVGALSGWYVLACAVATGWW